MARNALTRAICILPQALADKEKWALWVAFFPPIWLIGFIGTLIYFPIWMIFNRDRSGDFFAMLEWGMFLLIMIMSPLWPLLFYKFGFNPRR